MYAILSLHELHKRIEMVGGGDKLRQGNVQGAGLVNTTTNECGQQHHFL